MNTKLVEKINDIAKLELKKKELVQECVATVNKKLEYAGKETALNNQIVIIEKDLLKEYSALKDLIINQGV